MSNKTTSSEDIIAAVEGLIEKLKATKGVMIFDNVDFSHEGYWSFYYNISGQYNGKYFAFDIYKPLSDPDEFYSSYIIDHVTECKKQIKKLLSELTQIPFDARKKKVLFPEY